MSQGASEIQPFLVQQCTESSSLAPADHYLDGQLPTSSLLVAEHLIPHYEWFGTTQQRQKGLKLLLCGSLKVSVRKPDVVMNRFWP